MAATKLEGLPPDVLTAIIKSLPAGERHSSIPLVCQSLRAAAYTAAADDSPVTLRLRGERPAATLASFQRWLSHHGAASNISSLVIERECSPVVSPSVQLPAVALPSLHALRLVNAGDMEDLLPQLGKLKCLSSLELTGSNHGTRRADGRPAPITLGAWHQLLHAAQLTRLVLIQCLTERESISLMLEHLTALQELELSYTQHAFRCGDPWLMRGRLDWSLQPWLAPGDVHGNLRFLGRLHRLKSLTLKGIHIDDAGELAHLASSSHSAAAVAAGEGGDHADRVCSTGLHTLNLKRCTFSGAAAARSLLRAVGCLHGLRELSMGQTNLSGVDAASLRVLATLAHLRMLDLHWSDLPPGACSNLFAVPGAWPHMTELRLPQRLPRCSAYSFDVAEDWEALGSAPCPIQTSGDLQMLVAACPALQRLNIRRAVTEAAVARGPCPLARMRALQCDGWGKAISADEPVINLLKQELTHVHALPEPEPPSPPRRACAAAPEDWPRRDRSRQPGTLSALASLAAAPGAGAGGGMGAPAAPLAHERMRQRQAAVAARMELEGRTARGSARARRTDGSGGGSSSGGGAAAAAGIGEGFGEHDADRDEMACSGGGQVPPRWAADAEAALLASLEQGADGEGAPRRRRCMAGASSSADVAGTAARAAAAAVAARAAAAAAAARAAAAAAAARDGLAAAAAAQAAAPGGGSSSGAAAAAAAGRSRIHFRNDVDILGRHTDDDACLPGAACAMLGAPASAAAAAGPGIPSDRQLQRLGQHTQERQTRMQPTRVPQPQSSAAAAQPGDGAARAHRLHALRAAMCNLGGGVDYISSEEGSDSNDVPLQPVRAHQRARPQTPAAEPAAPAFGDGDAAAAAAAGGDTDGGAGVTPEQTQAAGSGGTSVPPGVPKRRHSKLG